MPDKNLIPFDLEAAKRGEPIIQRNGNPAKFIAYVPEAWEWPLLVYLIGSEDVDEFSADGKYWPSTGESEHDLFMAPKTPLKVWLNVYDAYPTKEKADAHAGSLRIACVEIDWPADAPWPWEE